MNKIVWFIVINLVRAFHNMLGVRKQILEGQTRS